MYWRHCPKCIEFICTECSECTDPFVSISFGLFLQWQPKGILWSLKCYLGNIRRLRFHNTILGSDQFALYWIVIINLSLHWILLAASNPFNIHTCSQWILDPNLTISFCFMTCVLIAWVLQMFAKKDGDSLKSCHASINRMKTELAGCVHILMCEFKAERRVLSGSE